jgi:hypothetical protein
MVDIRWCNKSNYWQLLACIKDAEENYGSELLNLVVAKGYVTKLLANPAVKSYIGRHEPKILSHLELVVNTVSMEEAVQQQSQAMETASGEAANGSWRRPVSSADANLILVSRNNFVQT